MNCGICSAPACCLNRRWWPADQRATDPSPIIKHRRESRRAAFAALRGFFMASPRSFELLPIQPVTRQQLHAVQSTRHPCEQRCGDRHRLTPAWRAARRESQPREALQRSRPSELRSESDNGLCGFRIMQIAHSKPFAAWTWKIRGMLWHIPCIRHGLGHQTRAPQVPLCRLRYN